MFLEKLVEQHRVDRVVSHTVDLPVFIPDCEARIDLSHLLGDEAIFKTLAWIDLFLVSEGYRLERKQGLAGIVHRLDGLFVTARGSRVTKQTSGHVHGNGVRSATTYRAGVNIADVGVIGLPSDTRHPGADIDVTVTRCCQDPRLEPQGGVVVASSVIQRATPAGRVVIASRIGKERGTTDGHVKHAGAVVKKCLVTNRRVFEPATLAKSAW